MNNPKPSIPKGTRDFGPSKMVRRNYIFDIIKSTFEKYGFQPLETPAMENLSTLTGKYGDEGDKLIFKILNSGDYLSKIQSTAPSKEAPSKEAPSKSPKPPKGGTEEGETLPSPFPPVKEFTPLISEKALRYDLTVPFARYVAMNQHEITFPFKRYQIQPVWRADRPQKGRYREFYQCDVDVIGSDSLLNEVELIQLIDEVFEKLGLRVVIKINNRKILQGIAEYCGIQNKFIEFVTILDKLDKIGIQNAVLELKKIGIDESKIEDLRYFLTPPKDYKEYIENISKKIKKIDTWFKDCQSEIGMRGSEEMQQIFSYFSHLHSSHLVLDITLARGLDYYTGTIIEVTTKDFPGSLCAGGRYDDLTGVFGLPGISGVGVSFGSDRIYDVLEELNLFPKDKQSTTIVMVTNFDSEFEKYSLGVLTKLRSAGINSEIYPQQAKLKKQMDYANKKSIPYVVLIGSEEIKTGKLTLRDMNSGKQEQLKPEEIIGKLSNIKKISPLKHKNTKSHKRN